MKASDLLRKILRDEAGDTEEIHGSTRIQDVALIEQFIENPVNTFLVSFPRTGSHWLRMLMELYFERPSLVRVFYYPDRTDYLSYHTHDMNLDVEHPTAIYLYREPVATIYSQLSYHKESIDDAERITYWSDLYGRHLDKWLFQEKFTTKKTVLSYEGLRQNMPAEFSKVTEHFGLSLDVMKLESANAATTKDELKRKTGHDQQVVNLKQDYADRRQQFTVKQSQLVWDSLVKGRPHLKDIF